VRQPDEVAPDVLEDLSVAPLELVGQGVAETGDGLVPVAAVQVDPDAVQEKPPVRPELGSGDAEADADDIDEGAIDREPALGPIEEGIAG
jgi:hypothetical protein